MKEKISAILVASVLAISIVSAIANTRYIFDIEEFTSQPPLTMLNPCQTFPWDQPCEGPIADNYDHCGEGQLTEQECIGIHIGCLNDCAIEHATCMYDCPSIIDPEENPSGYRACLSICDASQNGCNAGCNFYFDVCISSSCSPNNA